jgi:DNA-binding winged helix-turn-helix (wHTH) protein
MNMESTTTTEQERSGGAAATSVYPGRYARFGAFQADLASGELYQNGQRIKVQAKLFQALLVLLGRAGGIVTREEVRRQLWPDTSLTNLDANVNTTMNKLRQVLGDSSDNSRYIETIPRRGYSFMASVEFSDVRDLPPVEVENSVAEITTQSDARQSFWSKKHISTFLRVTSLLFAGMLLGALLAFIWFFAQGKNQRAANNVRESASLSMQDGFGATKPAAHLL